MPPKPQGLPKLTGIPKPPDLNVDVHVEVGGAALPNVERDGVRYIAALPGKKFEIAIANCGASAFTAECFVDGRSVLGFGEVDGGVASHANGPAGRE